MARITILNALPLNAGGLVEDSLAVLYEELVAQTGDVEFFLSSNSSEVLRAIESSSVIIVGDLRPGSDLMTASSLVNAKGKLVLFGCNYDFCEIGIRVCSTCRINRACRNSNRVAIYRELHERADVSVYLSPLHKEASEEYISINERRSRILVPPGLTPLSPLASYPEMFFTFLSSNDPRRAASVFAWAEEHPSVNIDVYGLSPNSQLNLPPNITPKQNPHATEKKELTHQYKTLLSFPSGPIPFGRFEALYDIDPVRQLITNDNLGFRSFDCPVEHLIPRSRSDIQEFAREIVLETSSTRSTKLERQSTFNYPLIWAHNLGLGDSINLLPFTEVLANAAGSQKARWVLPKGHKTLLDEASPSAQNSVAHEDFDIAQCRAEHDLFVEISIRHDELSPTDIINERWVRITLNQNPHAFQSIYENLLSILGRAQVTGMPGAPSIELNENEKTWAISELKSRGLEIESELIITIHPGAGARIKCWSPEKFGHLCNQLQSKGAKIVLIGGMGENDILDRIIAISPKCEWVARELELRNVAALIHHATIHVGNDSGLTHLAGAVGTPTAAIFGPSPAQIWGPTNPLSSVVYPRAPSGRATRNLKCLSVESVLSTCLAVLAKVAADVPRHLATKMVGKIGELNTLDFSNTTAQITLPNHDTRDLINLILKQAVKKPSLQLLNETHAPNLIEFAIATGLIVPLWSTPPSIKDWLEPDEGEAVV